MFGRADPWLAVASARRARSVRMRWNDEAVALVARFDPNNILEGSAHHDDA